MRFSLCFCWRKSDHFEHSTFSLNIHFYVGFGAQLDWLEDINYTLESCLTLSGEIIVKQWESTVDSRKRERKRKRKMKLGEKIYSLTILFKMFSVTFWHLYVKLFSFNNEIFIFFPFFFCWCFCMFVCHVPCAHWSSIKMANLHNTFFYIRTNEIRMGHLML